jgi:succinate dehydrogenase/fumarate reductase flavoprotein subunit
VIRAPHLEDSFGISFLLDDDPRIYNTDGDKFLPQRAAELGKDVLSRSLYAQIQAGKGTQNGGIYFDLTNVENSKLDLHPRFLTYCRRAGFNPYTQPLDVGPSQHYLCGGIRIDSQARSSLPGLYVAGEAAGGVHGADRLAGNSGSDVLVFGAQAGKQAANFAQNAPRMDLKVEDLKSQCSSLEGFSGIRSDIQTEGNLLQRLREVMWDQVGLIREAQGLEKAMGTILEIKSDAQALRAPTLDGQVKLLELENQVNLAEMICRAALLREETRGVHYRSDYTKRKDYQWLCHIVFSQSKNGLNMETRNYKWRREPTI